LKEAEGDKSVAQLLSNKSEEKDTPKAEDKKKTFKKNNEEPQKS